MKTQKELNALKEEVETLSRKLAELTGDELAQVAGGNVPENAAVNCPKMGECNMGENCIFQKSEDILDIIRCPFRMLWES